MWGKGITGNGELTCGGGGGGYTWTIAGGGVGGGGTIKTLGSPAVIEVGDGRFVFFGTNSGAWALSLLKDEFRDNEPEESASITGESVDWGWSDEETVESRVFSEDWSAINERF